MQSMRTSSKIAVLSLASGALLAAWLLTGDRKVRTRHFVARNAVSLRKVQKTEDEKTFDDSEIYYI